MDQPAVALRRSSRRPQNIKLPHRLPLRSSLQSSLFALLGLAIESLSHRSRPPHLAHPKDLHHELAAFILHPQHVANLDITCSLGRLLVPLDPAQLTSLSRQRPSLEEPSRPKPLIHPHRSHRIHSHTKSCLSEKPPSLDKTTPRIRYPSTRHRSRDTTEVQTQVIPNEYFST